MKKQIANIITSSRILSAISLLFCPVFSAIFYILYLFCGITDMIDGTVARKTKSVSEFGAKLDTVADFLFLIVCFTKMLPLIHIPIWVCIWISVIAIIKIGNIIRGYILKKQFISLHTISNKITGLLLFLLPLILPFAELKYSLIVVCSAATFATIGEWDCIATNHKKQ